jgi:hypothetical protein
MFDTCLSGLSASSRATTVQPNPLASAMTAFCTKPRNSFAATGFWKPILQVVPSCISGAS